MNKKASYTVKYFARACPKCNGYLGVNVPRPERKVSARAINGLCLKCGYRLAWRLIPGKRFAHPDHQKGAASAALKLAH